MFMEILDIVNSYSGVICVFMLILIAIIISSGANKIVKELKFLYRRSEILDVNDNMRHIPRDLKNDYFNKQEGDRNEC